MGRLPGKDVAERELRQACAQLDSEIRGGTPTRVESLLTKYPALAEDSERVIELILNEYAIRDSLGQPAEPAEFFERFPQYRERLQRLFAFDSFLKDSIVGPLESLDSSTVSEGDRGGATQLVRQVGSYEILETLGAGGMGVVYKAVQLGLNRTVAVKLLRSDSGADESTRSRFLREAELAAKLQHPNVVQVFEIGEHAGQPFLAMEYVPGINLHQRLDGRPLGLRAAAELLRTLARTMEHAHEKGVIHRDLKPANILLVGSSPPATHSRQADSAINADWESDARPNREKSARDDPGTQLTPKIADFGLAIQMDETRALTAFGQVLGTITYMAPEQAAGRSAAATAASDVYSLGAILYETITGRPPFLADGFRETLRLVLHQDPIPPSRLMPDCPRDLETICLKCLEKEPAKRYASAKLLADDLDRFLNSEPIAARPVGPMEKAWKWSKRRPWAAAFAGVSATAAIALAAIVTVYASRLDHAAREAQDGWNRANAALEQLRIARESEIQQRRRTRKALDLVTDFVVQDWIVRHPSLAPRHRQFLQEVLKKYTELAATSDDDPETRIGLANAYRRIGEIHSLLGRYPEAEAALVTARTEFGRLKQVFSDDPRCRIDWCSVSTSLCGLYELSDRCDEAIQVCSEGLEEARRLLEHPVAQEEAREMWAEMSLQRASLAMRLGRMAIAADALKESRRHWVGLYDKDSVSPTFRNGMLRLLFTEGRMAVLEADVPEAKNRFQEVIRLADGFLREENTNYRHLFYLAAAHLNLGRIIDEQEPSAGAGLQSMLRGVDLLERYVRAFPNRPAEALVIGRGYSAICVAWLRRNKAIESAAAGERAVAILEGLQSALPDSAELKLTLGGALCNYGNALRMQRRHEPAVQAYQRSLETLAECAAIKPSDETAKEFIGNAHMGKGHALALLGRTGEAIKDYRKALEMPVSDQVRGFVEREIRRIESQ